MASVELLDVAGVPVAGVPVAVAAVVVVVVVAAAVVVSTCLSLSISTFSSLLLLLAVMSVAGCRKLLRSLTTSSCSLEI